MKPNRITSVSCCCCCVVFFLVVVVVETEIPAAPLETRRRAQSAQPGTGSRAAGIRSPPGPEEGQVCFSVSKDCLADVTAGEGRRGGQVQGVKLRLR